MFTRLQCMKRSSHFSRIGVEIVDICRVQFPYCACSPSVQCGTRGVNGSIGRWSVVSPHKRSETGKRGYMQEMRAKDHREYVHFTHALRFPPIFYPNKCKIKCHEHNNQIGDLLVPPGTSSVASKMSICSTCLRKSKAEAACFTNASTWLVTLPPENVGTN
jgi:hypothetical protein